MLVDVAWQSSKFAVPLFFLFSGSDQQMAIAKGAFLAHSPKVNMELQLALISIQIVECAKH